MAFAPAELPFEIVWLGLSRAASGGQAAGLLMPAYRKRAKKGRQAGIAAAPEDRLNQIRRQQRQAQEFPKEGPIDLLGRRQFSQRSITPLVEHALVPVRPRQCLHQRRIGSCGHSGRAYFSRHDDRLPARAVADCQRHPDRDAGRARHAAALREGPQLQPGQAELVQPFAHRALVHFHREAARDFALQFNAAPAHHAIALRVRPLRDQRLQLRLLRRRQ